MNAEQLIETYVNDVARRLPRRRRADVAYELGALLDEGLRDRAESLARVPDAAMALEHLRAFGHPREVAARYREPLTIIDPADGRAFLHACVIGLALIWALAILDFLQRPFAGSSEDWSLLGRVWLTTLVQSLFWPGLLVVGFGLSYWGGRTRRVLPAWTPRDLDQPTGGRAGQVLAIIGILFGLFVLWQPHWLLDVVWDGRAAPAAYQALTYTDSFLQRQAPILFVLLLANLPLLVATIVAGRSTVRIRRIGTMLSVVLSGVMLWAAFDGPIMSTPASDETARGALLLIAVLTLAGLAIGRLRRLRPAPDRIGPVSATR